MSAMVHFTATVLVQWEGFRWLSLFYEDGLLNAHAKTIQDIFNRSFVSNFVIWCLAALPHTILNINVSIVALDEAKMMNDQIGKTETICDELIF